MRVIPGNELGSIAVSVLKSTTATRWLPPKAPPSAVTNPPTADTELWASAELAADAFAGASAVLPFAAVADVEGDVSLD